MLRCTNETCYLSDCATIIYLYRFKGEFRVRVGVWTGKFGVRVGVDG